MAKWKLATAEQKAWIEAKGAYMCPFAGFWWDSEGKGPLFKRENGWDGFFDGEIKLRESSGLKLCCKITKPKRAKAEGFPMNKAPTEAQEIVNEAVVVMEKALKADPINPSPKPESILAEAERIVNGERAADYGDSTANMERIGKITELTLSQAEWAKLGACSIPPTVVAKILMAVKLGREAHTHKRDNLVDLCGYAEILNRASGN